MATINVNIHVTVTARGEVRAEANPQVANPTDTITWVFEPASENLRVVFKKVELANNSGALLIHRQGPFSSPLSRGGGKTSGTIAQDAPSGRYIYDIHNSDNKKLAWLNPLSADQKFGGLDIPKSPPR